MTDACNLLVQGKGGHWNVETVLEGAALTDRSVYQQKLAEGRRKGLSLPIPQRRRSLAVTKSLYKQQFQQKGFQLDQEKKLEFEAANGMTEGAQQQIQQARETTRKLEEEKQQLQQQIQQLQKEKRQELEAANRRTEEAKERTQEHEKNFQHVLKQAVAKRDQSTKEIKQLKQELEAANRRNEEARERIRQLEEEKQQILVRSEEQTTQVQHLQQQLATMTTQSSEQPYWVVRREEVMLTSEVLGSGGWGEVKVAHFRGLRVAAKTLHRLIISQYNLRQFMREMDISAKLRHPNLLLFIGATREGRALILTEVMPTSLRQELEKGELSRGDITTISKDVACGLSYLHQWKPHPIIHRDISSGNVLLEPLRNGWRAKVSDYGSANSMNMVSSTVNPGCPVYAAPEGNIPRKHSPKMDVFSFGVLLIEMCLAEFPESRPEKQEAQIKRIQWSAMVSLIRRCITESPDQRPTMEETSQLLSRLE